MDEELKGLAPNFSSGDAIALKPPNLAMVQLIGWMVQFLPLLLHLRQADLEAFCQRCYQVLLDNLLVHGGDIPMSHV